jgi:hypothetical protein
MIKKVKLIFRHAVVSVFCASSDYIIFLTLYSILHFSLIAAFLSSYIVVSSIGFLGHVFFTFKLKKISFKNILYFASQLFFVGVIGFFVLRFFLIFMSAQYAKLLQLSVVFFFSVIYGKLVTFRR